MTSDFWASLREARIKAANHLWDFWVEAVYSFKKKWSIQVKLHLCAPLCWRFKGLIWPFFQRCVRVLSFPRAESIVTNYADQNRISFLKWLLIRIYLRCVCSVDTIPNHFELMSRLSVVEMCIIWFGDTNHMIREQRVMKGENVGRWIYLALGDGCLGWLCNIVC